jgi:serine/threonine protein kinase/formylglycine-generating enzyme required for sulfatase activity
MKICPNPSCRSILPDNHKFCTRCGALLPEVKLGRDPLLGEIIGVKYKITEVLGQGGMGKVYLAVNLNIDRLVAIKILAPQLLANDPSLKQFQREAKILGRLSHPNIVSVLDYDRTPSGFTYIVMEYIPGISLGRKISEEGVIAPGLTIDYTISVCRGLAYAHKKGIVHRDLKPGNIMVTTDETEEREVKILDFGIAKIRELSGEQGVTFATGTRMIFGTPEYMSPEQAKGERELDGRSDLYSLGCVVYEMLTGRTPFVADNFIGYITKHLNEPPPLLREIKSDLPVPYSLEDLLLEMLAKEKEKRPQGADKVIEELEKIKKKLSTATGKIGKKEIEPILAKMKGGISPLAKKAAASFRVLARRLKKSMNLRKLSPLVTRFGMYIVLSLIVIGGVFGIIKGIKMIPPGELKEESSKNIAKRGIKESGTKEAASKIKGGKTTPSPSDKLADASLFVVCDPSGTDIIIDGKPRGKTPEMVKLASGKHRLELRSRGYVPLRREIKIEKGKDLRLYHELLKIPNDMVYVPPGSFIIGTGENRIKRLRSSFPDIEGAPGNEYPRRKMFLPGFLIDKYEVTNIKYSEFLRKTGHKPPPDWKGRTISKEIERLPVVNVSLADAEAYARFSGKRLPTEEEWEKAARGRNGRTYPWGNSFIKNGGYFVSYHPPFDYLDPVKIGSFPKGKSPYGTSDMAGNIWEWTKSPYLPYPGNKGKNAGYSRNLAVIRGGGHNSMYSLDEKLIDLSSFNSRCARRMGVPPDTKKKYIGFRLVKDIPYPN